MIGFLKSSTGVGPVTSPLEAETFDPMQACRTRMARTCLAQMRTLRFCSALIVGISLLMVLMPSAHGFVMTPHGSTAHGMMTAADRMGTDGDDTPRVTVLNGAIAAPSDAKAPVLAKDHHHPDLCCIGGDPSGNGESTTDTCTTACCFVVMIACRHHVAVLVSAETSLLLPIPPSASSGGIYPPPKSARMI